jgi:hypothetical protein
MRTKSRIKIKEVRGGVRGWALCRYDMKDKFIVLRGQLETLEFSWQTYAYTA